jgi:hypothetical protein
MYNADLKKREHATGYHPVSYCSNLFYAPAFIMKNPRTSLFSLIILLLAFPASAGTRAVVEVEEIEGDKIEKSIEIITFDENRFRIDLLGADGIKTDQTPYIMTINGGVNWVIGDKPRDKFYCSKMQTVQFFKDVGARVTNAIEFFNVKAESPTVKKVLEEPGPEILGFKTTHLQIEVNAMAYAWFFFIKFEYTVKIINDLWYTADLEMHPVRKKWINALSQSGNSIIDSLFTDITSEIKGQILKSETVYHITDVRKKETRTQTSRKQVTEIRELKPGELDKIFKMPDCITMDDDEVEEKAKALFSAHKFLL